MVENVIVNNNRIVVVVIGSTFDMVDDGRLDAFSQLFGHFTRLHQLINGRSNYLLNILKS